MKKSQKIIFNRRLNSNYIRKKMTVGIAAICEEDNSDYLPKIVLCADRLVSAGVEFEGGSPKIRQLTPYCYAMYSSNNSLATDSILSNSVEDLNGVKDILKINHIASVVSNKCKDYRDQYYEDNVLQKYNMTASKIKGDPTELTKMALNEINSTTYPFTFEFIILGLDMVTKSDAHIFSIDENGYVKPWDSIGFTTTGSGGELAFLEMTKNYYSKTIEFTDAVPRVYFAKKMSERAQGVGRFTDLHVLFYGADDKKNLVPQMSSNLLHGGFGEKLDSVFDKLIQHERDEISKLSNELRKMLVPDTKSEPEIENKN